MVTQKGTLFYKTNNPVFDCKMAIKRNDRSKECPFKSSFTVQAQKPQYVYHLYNVTLLLSAEDLSLKCRQLKGNNLCAQCILTTIAGHSCSVFYCTLFYTFIRSQVHKEITGKLTRYSQTRLILTLLIRRGNLKTLKPLP